VIIKGRKTGKSKKSHEIHKRVEFGYRRAKESAGRNGRILRKKMARE
jgi:hypothetical protein